MEFQRRIGHGRLSEIFGAATLPQDRFLRTVGFGRAARSAWERLPADVRQQVDAYVAGVNAFIDAHHGSRSAARVHAAALRTRTLHRSGRAGVGQDDGLGPQRELLARVDAPRHPRQARPRARADAAAALSGRWPEHPDRSAAADAGARRARPRPRRTSDTAPDAWPAFEQLLSSGPPRCATFLLGGAPHEAIGSNNWVVDGTMTASGKPLLANDPHLGTQHPVAVVSRARLGRRLRHHRRDASRHAGRRDRPQPQHRVGRDERRAPTSRTCIARSSTRPARRRVPRRPGTDDGRPGDRGRQGRRAGRRQRPHHTPRSADLRRDQRQQRRVRRRRRGHRHSSRWPSAGRRSTTTTSTIVGVHAPERRAQLDRVHRRRCATSWRRRRTSSTPTSSGHIGYYAPAASRSAPPATARSRPTAGRGDAEWTGWVPVRRTAARVRPARALHRHGQPPAVPARYPQLIGLEYPESLSRPADHRSDRELSATRKLTPNDFPDPGRHAVAARTRPAAAPARARPAAVDARRAGRRHPAHVGFRRSADSAAPAIFQAWFLQLAPALAGDELGPLRSMATQGRFSYITRFHRSDADVTTAVLVRRHRARRQGNLRRRPSPRRSHDGVADLADRLGTRHGHAGDGTRVHRAVFPHQGLDAVGALRPLLEPVVPNGGDWSTVNVGPVAADAPYDDDIRPRLPADRRSVAGQRQPVPRVGGAVRPLPVVVLRLVSRRLAGGPLPEDADGPADGGDRCDRTPAADAGAALTLRRTGTCAATGRPRQIVRLTAALV